MFHRTESRDWLILWLIAGIFVLWFLALAVVSLVTMPSHYAGRSTPSTADVRPYVQGHVTFDISRDGR